MNIGKYELNWNWTNRLDWTGLDWTGLDWTRLASPRLVSQNLYQAKASFAIINALGRSMNEWHMIVESNSRSPRVLLIHLFCIKKYKEKYFHLAHFLSIFNGNWLDYTCWWHYMITVTLFFQRNLRRPFPRAVSYQNLNGVVSVFNKVVDGDIMLFIGKFLCLCCSNYNSIWVSQL